MDLRRLRCDAPLLPPLLPEDDRGLRLRRPIPSHRRAPPAAIFVVVVVVVVVVRPASSSPPGGGPTTIAEGDDDDGCGYEYDRAPPRRRPADANPIVVVVAAALLVQPESATSVVIVARNRVVDRTMVAFRRGPFPRRMSDPMMRMWQVGALSRDGKHLFVRGFRAFEFGAGVLPWYGGGIRQRKDKRWMLFRFRCRHDQEVNINRPP